MTEQKVIFEVENKIIPTYLPDEPEVMPMYQEARQYQGSTGYTYPNRVRFNFQRETMTDKEYTLVRLENDYIRVVMLPELGGRIWEGYDKVNDYHFFFHATSIKPVAVATCGPFIGGGMEFNTPFFHKVSTYMPYDWKLEECEDGSKIVWLSEAFPAHGQYRMKITYGIKLRPDTSYLETLVKLDNRTPVKHPFLWWESAGVNINDNYQLFYPQDVGYVHHHYDRHHIAFPIINEGNFGVETHEEGCNVSIVKNSKKGNSYFAGPSKYDFFGGYDNDRKCGTMHIGDHHITRGRKIFVWGKEELADAWNSNMSSLDHPFGEMMAGSYVDDQPDYLPALVEMAESCYNEAHYKDALLYIHKAEKVLNKYNPNNYDGTAAYLKGLCLFGQERYDEVYESLYKASCSYNMISPSMTLIAAIDGQRKNYVEMKKHAKQALEHERSNAVSRNYLAIAEYKLGNTECARKVLEDTLDHYNSLDHFERFLQCLYQERSLEDFYAILKSDPAETCLDIAFNLLDAGCEQEAALLLENLGTYRKRSAMANYTLAYIYDRLGRCQEADSARKCASEDPYVDVFPARLEEIRVLKAAVQADANDYVAWYLYGCILYDKNFPWEAAKAQEHAIQANPDFYIPYRNLAIIYFSRLDRKDEALELLMKACSLKPNDDTLMKETSYVMSKMGVDDNERITFMLDNMPEKLSDNLTWELAYAYNHAGKYDQAIETLLGHSFLAAEFQETFITYPWTFAQCCKGRLLREEGKLEEALECFRLGQTIQENFHAGWWDKQTLYSAVIYEAETLQMLGREEEAKEVAGKLIPFIHSGYSLYMGSEVEVFIAMVYRILGKEMTAKVYIGKNIAQWEQELLDDEDRKQVITAVHYSYKLDAVKQYKGAVLTALAYSRLFFGDKEGAADYFTQSLLQDPDNYKAKFELRLLKKIM